MATNGILDIQETTEDFRDPDMELSPEETMDIIKTLQVVGVPQEHYGEYTDRFREWKQNNNGTFDMFLEEIHQLAPGTITKIKTEQLVAQGPEDALQTEEEMTIQPGSGDMLEIMQSVGVPQRASLGGRIGYQGGEIVLPQPRPEHDPRLEFFKRMGAMPEQTLLRQAQPMRGQVPEGIMGQAPDPYGGLLGGQEGDIGMGGQPLVPYEHEGAEQPPSWVDRLQTGTYDAALPQTPEITKEMVMDFLRKMGMPFTKENFKKVWEALLAAVKFGPGGAAEAAGGLGLEGLRSLGAPEEVEETETISLQEGGGVHSLDELAFAIFQKPYSQLTSSQQYELNNFKPEPYEPLPKAEGGIIDVVPRQGYFIGNIVKAITSAPKKILKSAKKILKSDLGKMAMLYVATAGFSNLAAQQGLGGAQKWFGKGGWKWLQPQNVGINIKDAVSRVIPASWKNVAKAKDALALTESGTIDWAAMDAANKAQVAALGDLSLGGATTGSTLGTALAKAPTPWYKGALPWIAGASLAGGAYTAKNPGETQFDMGKRDEEVDDITEWLAAIQPAPATTFPYPDYVGAKGGRVGYANGGILDIEEIDLRDNGGFMPLGKKEKADDVPALLSKNEFVFTADAVKSAGDGDPDVGAERMQNVMKNLEAGGKISEESQGLEGAQEMFEVSERLSEVV